MKHLTSQGSPLPPKLYCVTMLNDELDLLELRFREQESAVDTWVIVEAGQTHAGGSKPLHLTESLKAEPERWKKWVDRINVVTIPRFPYSSDPWIRERYQRDSGLRALGWAEGHDFVLCEDCDEIASADAIREAVEGPSPCRFVLDFHYYGLNCRRKTPWIQGSTMARRVQVLGLSILRAFPHQRPIVNGGVHVSYFGGVNRIVKKITEFAHVEEHLPHIIDPERIQNRIDRCADLFDRGAEHWERVQSPDQLHPMILRNWEHWKKFWPADQQGQIKPNPVESRSALVGLP